jgi:uncharacterized protein YfaS (alpha-2-macroglobulin family)
VKQGAGRLYYQMRMKYAPQAPVKPRDEGIAVKREYFTLAGKSLDASMITVGQPFVVTLTVSSKRDRLFVVVNDPVPAGCEIIDPSLSVVSPDLASRISALNQNESDYWWGSWNHVEYRDQRCLVFADFLNAGTHTYSYLLRPTIEGRYVTPPARAEEMYSPEVFGSTDQMTVIVKR